MNDNKVESVMVFCIFLLIVLTLGEQDILDGLIKMVNE